MFNQITKIRSPASDESLLFKLVFSGYWVLRVAAQKNPNIFMKDVNWVSLKLLMQVDLNNKYYYNLGA